ncbi:MAG: DUF1704 domain-containing protein [Candidatus Magasanikbacteria bacterium]|jgi:hypothetical protein|nr:DUF1704 domain-containing protein [Candidatus Magasanikbacteria bacterium]
MEGMRRREQEPLDAQWYGRFEGAGSFQAYEYFSGDREARAEQKRAFMDGEIDAPALDYPKLNMGDLQTKEDDLLALKKDILNKEPNPDVKQAYRWKINEKIAEVRMMKAALNGNMKRFSKYTSFVYGEPSAQVFGYTLATESKKAHDALSSDNPDIAAAAQQLIEILPEGSAHDVAALPTQNIVDAMQVQTLDAFSEAMAAVDTKVEQYEAGQIQEVFREAMSSLELTGWTVEVVDTGKTSISVNQEEKKVVVPEGRSMTAKKLQQLIVHEIGTHVARRVNGEHSKLQLLGLGLDRYERGEEGVATMREQAVTGDVQDFAGMAGHLGIALARGVDGQKRGFREVYEIIRAQMYLEKLLSGMDPAAASGKADTLAYNRSVRVFRGTDGKTPGVCFTKDMIYREGNIDIWNLVGEDPDAAMQFSVGKYDPSNPEHLALLSRLGITDTDLAA